MRCCNEKASCLSRTPTITASIQLKLPKWTATLPKPPPRPKQRKKRRLKQRPKLEPRKPHLHRRRLARHQRDRHNGFREDDEATDGSRGIAGDYTHAECWPAGYGTVRQGEDSL